MSTRAQIRFATREDGVSFSEHPNAIHAQFYKHHDGYPEGLGLDLAQLKQLKRNVSMLIEDIAVDNVSSMRVGSKVTINHPKAPGTWTINKINRKTVVVEQDGRRVKSHMSLLVAA